jgi:hypothetical protein
LLDLEAHLDPLPLLFSLRVRKLQNFCIADQDPAAVLDESDMGSGFQIQSLADFYGNRDLSLGCDFGEVDDILLPSSLQLLVEVL